MTEKEVLIRVEGVSKKFCKDLKTSLKYGFQDVLSEMFKKTRNVDLRQNEFWALQDISFELKRGESLGLIGHNGAGKSTLLKMLNGLLRPDKGSIDMHGKVGALIELGAGFNMILTGRENIYNNAAVLGFSKEEVDEKFEDIIDFSEIRDFIDTPVQYYSSGMKVRLGFAIAAQMQPDILLIDEVLAVGDMGFSLKCFNRIDQLLPNTAIIYVSHSMPQVARMCTKALLMDKGKVIYYSEDVPSVLTQYYNQFKLEVGDYKGSDTVNLTKVRLGSNGKWWESDEDIIIEFGAELLIELTIDSSEIIENPELGFAFYDKEQRNIAETYNFIEELKLSQLKCGSTVIEARFEDVQFTQGKYSLTIAMNKTELGSRIILFRFQSAVYFTVHGDVHGWAAFQLKPQWKLLS